MPTDTTALGRVAIVNDWLVTYAGAERVLEQILLLLPQAELFTLVDALPERDRIMLHGRTPHTSYLQRLPWTRKLYRYYLPFMPLAVEQFDLRAFDTIITSSHAVAHGIITAPDQRHIAYVHSPLRYAWDMQNEYLERQQGWQQLLKPYMRLKLHQLRQWDFHAGQRPDQIIANSHFIQRRIAKTWRRQAAVIHPPVDTSAIPFSAQKEDFYLSVCRLVAYKRVDLMIEAFRHLPQERLIVIGDGPEYTKLAANLPANVTLLGYQPTHQVHDYMCRAKALLYAAQEDFGMVMVEAQAAGTPVIAYGRGGALDILAQDTPSLEMQIYNNGILFPQQSPAAIMQAIEASRHHHFDTAFCRQNAQRFSVDRFRQQLLAQLL